MERPLSRDGSPLPPIYAGFWKRLGANLTDALVLTTVNAPLLALTLRSKALAVVIAFVSSGAIGFLYTIYFHATYGQTLGKMALRIKVLRTDGERIGWHEAFWRSSVDVAFWAILSLSSVVMVISMPEERFVGSSWATLQAEIERSRGTVLRYLEWLWSAWLYSEVVTLLFNEKKRALHDFIAGTVVVLKGSQALVAQTQFAKGPPPTAGKVIRVGLQGAAVAAAAVVAMLAYIVGAAYFLARTDIGAALGERLGVFSDRVVEVAPGVRLTRPRGWNVTDDGPDGYTVSALGSRGDAQISVWSVAIKELPGIADGTDGDLSALGPAVATAQRTRAATQLQGTWAAGFDPFKGHELERSQVVSMGGRQWGEDFWVRRAGGKQYVLINRYTVHGDAVIVVVDGYDAAGTPDAQLQDREAVVAPVLEALQFSP